MSYIYNSIPFEIYTFFCIAFIPFGFYAAWITEKRTPGHPGKYLCIAISFVSPLLWLARCTNEYSASVTLSEIMDVVAVIVSILFLVGIFVTLYFAEKYGYTDKSKTKKVVPLIKSCGIIILICVVGIIILNHI